LTTSEAGQGGATEAALALINGVAGGEQETLGPQVREEETQRFILAENLALLRTGDGHIGVNDVVLLNRAEAS